MNRQDIFIIIVGVILSVLSIVLGGYDKLWNYIGLSNNIRGDLTIALSIFFLLIAFIIAFGRQLTVFLRKVEKLSRETPPLKLLEEKSGEEAFRVLIKRISVAEAAYNTKLFPEDYSKGYSEDAMNQWHTAISRTVKNGLIFREVISPTWESQSRQRLTTLSNKKGMYEVSMHNAVEFPILNFTILKLKNGDREIYFGWLMTPSYGFDKPCIISKDARIIEFFEQWFSALYSSGKQLNA